VAHRAKATECKECGSLDLHIGALCKLHHTLYMKLYNKDRASVYAFKKKQVYMNDDEKRQYHKDYYQKNKKEIIRKQKERSQGIYQKSNTVKLEKVLDVSEFKEYKRPDGSIYKAIMPIMNHHILIGA
jgi:hypothetical protein